MKVFSPAFQGTALPKDVKTVLPCQYWGRAESKQKTNETVGEWGGRTSGFQRTGQVHWVPTGLCFRHNYNTLNSWLLILAEDQNL